MRPPRTWTLLAFTLLAGMTLLACGLSDVFSSPGPESVVLTYEGDTILTVGDSVPLIVTVTVGGESVSHPRLQIVTSNVTVVGLSASQDSLFALAQGKDTLTVRLQSSIFTENAPTLVQPLRVRP